MTKVVDSIKNALGKSFCNICLSETWVHKYDDLELCSSCIKKVKELEKEPPFEIDKSQKAGALKDEL